MPQGRMRNPRDPYAEFLERALNCDRMAEKASDPALAKAFKKLAEQWRRSAKLHPTGRRANLEGRSVALSNRAKDLAATRRGRGVGRSRRPVSVWRHFTALSHTLSLQPKAPAESVDPR